ncbi:MAG: hypothetical protein ACI87W_003533 [Halieaceae bacterium]|jgi:hypothetical protein
MSRVRSAGRLAHWVRITLFGLAVGVLPAAQADTVEVLSRDPAAFAVLGTINIDRDWMADALTDGDYATVAELLGEEGAKLNADGVLLLNHRGKIIRPKSLIAVEGDRAAAKEWVARIQVIAAVSITHR